MKAIFLLVLALVAGCLPGRVCYAAEPQSSPTPVIDWSNEARRAIVPPGPNGIFGSENYGNKFPGEAAVYMGIVHTAIYEAAIAISGSRVDHAEGNPPDFAASAIATAAHHTLVGLQPALGLTPAQQATLDADYAAYIDKLPGGQTKSAGIAIGERVATAVLATRVDDGRDKNPTLGDLNPPAPGPGVWAPAASPVLGLRLPGIKPLVLESAAQFRPDGPYALTSSAFAEDFNQVEEMGRVDSTVRSAAQTEIARFWFDHDARQWNDGLLQLAAARGLDLLQTARMLAMAHVAGGDAMVGCFEAKYTYWFWRPYQAIPLAAEAGNPAIIADPTWKPLGSTPNFPEYPSAHACHSTAVAEALASFFGTSRVSFSLDSRVTGTHHDYTDFEQVVDEVDQARVWAGFHFFHSDLDGSILGRNVARYVIKHRFSPGHCPREKPTVPHAPPTFTAVGNMITARANHTATLLPSGKVLIAGGSYGMQSLANAELYDPALKTFTATGNLAKARTGHTATLLLDGRVLIAGGRDGSQPLISAELYDPIAGTFTPTGSMAPASVQAAPLVPRPALLLSTGKVLFADDNAQLYDPTTGSFALARPYADTGPVVWNTATSLLDGRVLLTGFAGSPPVGGAAELFDPQSGTFNITGQRKDVELGQATLLADGTVLVVTPSFDISTDDADVYDPASGAFTHVGQTLGFHAFSADVRLANGSVLISGGQLAGGNGSASAELYLPTARKFVSTSGMIVGRDSHTATLLTDGTVLLAGGITIWGSPPQVTSAAEIYNP